MLRILVDSAPLVFRVPSLEVRGGPLRGATLGKLVTKINGVQVSNKVVDGDLIISAEHKAGDILEISREIPLESPVNFSPSAGIPTPSLMNKLVTWMLGHLQDLWEGLESKMGFANGKPEWDAHGITIGNLGAPTDETSALSVGAANELIRQHTAGLSQDMDKLATAISEDISILAAELRRKIKAVEVAQATEGNQQLDLMDMIRQQDKRTEQLRESLAKSNSKASEAMASLESSVQRRLSELEKPKVREVSDVATMDDISMLASGMTDELRMVSNRIDQIQESLRYINEQRAEADGKLNGVNLRFASLDNQRRELENKLAGLKESTGVPELAEAMSQELELLGSRIAALEYAIGADAPKGKTNE